MGALPKTRSQCPPGDQCVNVEQLRGETRAMIERFRAESRELFGKAMTEIRVSGSKLEDVRRSVSAMPRDVVNMIKREREDAGERFEAGSAKFKKLFDLIGTLTDRVNRNDKLITVLWILVMFIGFGTAGKLLAWLIPAIGGFLK